MKSQKEAIMMRFFVVVAAVLVLGSSSAWAQVSALVGVDSSWNLGERPGALVGFRMETKELKKVNCESSTFFDSSQKLEGGWKFGQSGACRLGGRIGVVAGMDFRHRDGGPWVKRTIWGVLGASWKTPSGEIRVTYRTPWYESYPNKVRGFQMELRLKKPESRFGLALVEGFIFYQDNRVTPLRRGWFQIYSVTVALNKKKDGG